MYSPYEPSSQRIVTGGPGPQQARNHRECGAAVARARTEALTVARKLQLDRTAAVHTHELADRPYLLVVVLPALQVLRGDPDLRGGGAHAMSGSTGRARSAATGASAGAAAWASSRGRAAAPRSGPPCPCVNAACGAERKGALSAWSVGFHPPYTYIHTYIHNP